MTTARPIEIEPWTNRYAVHRLSAWMLPRAVRLRLHPNAVTAAGLLMGLAAAACYTGWEDWRFAVAGFLLMVGWHVMDGLDGQLARATARTSALGRLLDGLADYATFVAVYLALAFTHPQPQLAFPLAAAAGLAHALQAQFYEGERATYIRRLAGRFRADSRPETGGPFERLYNRAEALLANRTRPFDTALAAMPAAERARVLADWQPRAARTLRAMSPLSANGRTLAILAAALLGEPMLFWGYEIVALTALALAAAAALRQAEAGATTGARPTAKATTRPLSR
jgi:phosphatidylglycerophosphate synthase